ncbi:MAG: hypothetical protein AB7N76_09560 [Planctomycetota bacterium]
MTKNRRLNVRAEARTCQALEALAARTPLSRSALAGEALRLGLEVLAADPAKLVRPAAPVLRPQLGGGAA